MKIKTTIIALAACMLSASVFGQSVLLQIRSWDFADAGGDNVNTGLYGIVGDTDGSGFQQGNWGPSSFDRDTFLNLQDGTQSTNAFVSDLGPIESAAESNIFGYINERNVNHSSGAGLVGTGDAWGILWFPGIESAGDIGVGTSYGFYTADELTIPSAGDAVNYASFVSEDIKTADYTVVPEPSTYAAIFGFGVLLFVFLRRRFKK